MRPLASAIAAFTLSTLLASCGQQATAPVTAVAVDPTPAADPVPAAVPEFQYEADRFADIRILRYQIPGFEELSLQQKKLLFFLTQAGMSGRDITWDQNYKHNLRIRRVLEEIVRHYPGDRSTPEFEAVMTYAKRVWFANGIHHHYGGDKFVPGFTPATLRDLALASDVNATWPLDEGQSLDQLLTLLEPVLFDPAVDPKSVNIAADVDKVTSSAVNFYEGVTEAEVTAFYAAKTNADPQRPVMHGLNTKLVRENGDLVEKVWKLDGMYSDAIERIVYWLEQAITVAETDAQRRALELLVQYYRSGDLADFDAYNVAWVADTVSQVDVTNGFIEV